MRGQQLDTSAWRCAFDLELPFFCLGCANKATVTMEAAEWMCVAVWLSDSVLHFFDTNLRLSLKLSFFSCQISYLVSHRCQNLPGQPTVQSTQLAGRIWQILPFSSLGHAARDHSWRVVLNWKKGKSKPTIEKSIDWASCKKDKLTTQSKKKGESFAKSVSHETFHIDECQL